MINYRIKYYITANRINDIKNLQPDTVVPVFHGSDHNYIYSFCLNGIDARQPVNRLYPHYIKVGGKNHVVNRGLFVSPELATALDFGRAVIKFKILAKNLFPPFPLPAIMRSDNERLKKIYPNSFNPALSQWMLSQVNNKGGQWNDNKGGERQALFRGVLSPRAIEKVYISDYLKDGTFDRGVAGKYKWSIDRSGYLNWYENVFGTKNTPDKSMFEPQENISVEEFFTRINNKYKQLSRDYIEGLFDGLEGLSFQKQVNAVRSFGGSPSMSWSFAKRMTPKLLKYFGVERGVGEPHHTTTYTGRYEKNQ